MSRRFASNDCRVPEKFSNYAEWTHFSKPSPHQRISQAFAISYFYLSHHMFTGIYAHSCRTRACRVKPPACPWRIYLLYHVHIPVSGSGDNSRAERNLNGTRSCPRYRRVCTNLHNPSSAILNVLPFLKSTNKSSRFRIKPNIFSCTKAIDRTKYRIHLPLLHQRQVSAL